MATEEDLLLERRQMREYIAVCERGINKFIAKAEETNVTRKYLMILTKDESASFSPADYIEANEHMRISPHHIAGMWRTRRVFLKRINEINTALKSAPALPATPPATPAHIEIAPSVTAFAPVSLTVIVKPEWKRTSSEMESLRQRIEALRATE